MAKYYTHKYSGEEIDAMCDIVNGGAVGGQAGSVDVQGAVVAAQAARDEARSAAAEAEGYVGTAQQAVQDAQAAVDSFRPAEQQRQANEVERQKQEEQREADHAEMLIWEPYGPAKQYQAGNKVSLNGSSYACKVPCRGIMPPDDRCWVLIAARGDKGERGKTGAQGYRGETGERGATGAKGDQGERGQKGKQGIQGEKGGKGDAGAKGDSGVTVPTNGFFSLWVDNETGDFYVEVPDGADKPPVEMDENGDIYITV